MRKSEDARRDIVLAAQADFAKQLAKARAEGRREAFLESARICRGWPWAEADTDWRLGYNIACSQLGAQMVKKSEEP